MSERVGERIVSVAIATAVVGLCVAVIGPDVGAAIARARDPNQGLDTTCGDFLEMSEQEQLAVLEKTGHWIGHLESGVSFYREGCDTPHPEDRDEPIRYMKH